VAPLLVKPVRAPRPPSLQLIFSRAAEGRARQQAYKEHLTRSVAEVCNSYGEPDESKIHIDPAMWDDELTEA